MHCVCRVQCGKCILNQGAVLEGIYMCAYGHVYMHKGCTLCIHIKRFMAKIGDYVICFNTQRV